MGADYMEWKALNELIESLIKEKKGKIAACVAAQSYMGLRMGDAIRLKWHQLMEGTVCVVEEQKTGKVRHIQIHKDLKSIIQRCYQLEKPTVSTIGVNRKGRVFSPQYYITELKRIKEKHNIQIENFSSHTFRKAFGRRIYETNGANEHALVLLMDIFNHSSLALTRRYLGLRQEEFSLAYNNM